MGKCIPTLEATEMVGKCSYRKTIGVAGRDVKRIEHPQAVHQIRDRLTQR